MATTIKGITIQFRGDTSQLDKALKTVKSETKSVESALKEVDRALKFNPGNTTLLQQKFDLLKQRVQGTKNELEVLKSAQKQLDDDPSVDKTSAQYQELARKIVIAESKVKTFEANMKRFGSVASQQVAAVGKKLQAVGGKISAAGKKITSTVSMYGAAAVYSGAKLIESANKQAEAENKLAEIYKSRMGVGKESVQSTLDLASAQQKLGVVGDEVQIAGAQQLATYATMPGTVNTLLPALNNLLVQQKGLNGTQEDAVGLANLFGKAMMGQTGALKRAGISFTAAQEEVLKYGTEEEKAAMISEVVTQNVGNMNAEFAKTDAGKIQQAKNALGDMGEEVGALLLPAVAEFVGYLSKNVMPKLQQLIDYLKEHPQIAKFALAFAAIATVLGPVLVVVGSLISSIGTIISLAPALGAAFTAMTGPVGIAIAAIAALIAIGIALYKNWDKIKEVAAEAWGAIKDTITGIMTAIKDFITGTWDSIKEVVSASVQDVKDIVIGIWNGIKTAASVVFNGIKVYFETIFGIYRTIFQTAFGALKIIVETVMNGIKAFYLGIFNAYKTIFTTGWGFIKNITSKAWNGIKNAMVKPIEKARDLIRAIIEKIKGFFNFKFKVPHIKLPHFAISPKGWQLGDLLQGSIPSLGIQWYKKGGIFNSPSVIGVGEAGPEAVIPIEKLQGMMNSMADSIVNGMLMGMQLQAAGGGGDIVIQNYLYKNGPQMGETIVKTYDQYKGILG